MIWRLITLEDCASSSRLGVAFWASKRHCGLPVNEVCEGLGVYLEDLPEWLGEVCVTLAQGEYGEDWVSWAACSGLGVLRFKYLAALTRHTVVTATGTGPTNHCLQQVIGFIFPFLYLLLLLVKSLYVRTIFCLHWVTACSVWLHNIFLPDPYYIAAISHCAFTLLNTWLWPA